MVNKIKQIILLIGLGIMCAGNVNAQMFEHFLMKEGLQEAKQSAKNVLTNPVLVVVLAADNLNDASLPESLRMIYEGTDIGKSNNWMFVFTEEGNPNNAVAYVILKAFGMFIPTAVDASDFAPLFSFSHPIDEEELMDSDEFIASLINNSDFNQASVDTIASIGIFTLNYNAAGQYGIAPCFSVSEKRYYYFTQSYNDEGTYLSCCYTPYSDASEIACENYVGIKEIGIATHFTISPNPTSADALASFGLLVSGEMTIEVCDLLGNVIYTTTNFYEAGEHSVTLNVKGIANGSYICRLSSKDKQIGTAGFVVGK